MRAGRGWGREEEEKTGVVGVVGFGTGDVRKRGRGGAVLPEGGNVRGSTARGPGGRTGGAAPNGHRQCGDERGEGRA